jgi:hypothetical protein
MAILRHRPPEVTPDMQAMQQTYDQSVQVVSSLYQGTLHDRVPYVTTPEGRDEQLFGVEKPLSIPGFISLENAAYLPANPKSSNLFERTTGKVALLHYVTGHNAMTGGDTEAVDQSLVNIRAAQGRVMFRMIEDAYREAGVAWEFAGAERIIGIYGYSSETGKYHFLRCLSDLHPASEIDMYVKQSVHNQSTLDYSLGVPFEPVVDDEILFQTTGERRQYDKLTGEQIESVFLMEDGQTRPLDEIERLRASGNDVRRKKRLMTADALMQGLRVKSLLLEHGAEKVSLLPEDVRRTISDQDIQDMDFIPSQGSGMSSFVYRMAKFHNRQIRMAKEQGLIPEDFSGSSLFNEGVLNADYKRKFGDELIRMACYEMVVRRIQHAGGKAYNGVFGSIGLLDTNDPGMDHITGLIAEQMGIDMDDPNQRKVLQGTVFISNKMNGVLNNGMTHQPPGGRPEAIGLFRPFYNTPNDYADYRGFFFLDNGIQEIETGTNGRAPMIPGWLSNIVLPRTVTEAGSTTNVLAIIDLMEAPGALIEQVAFQSNDIMKPWQDEQTRANYAVTIDRTLQGDYVNASEGTPASRISRISHALLNLSGNVADERGIMRDMRPVGTLAVEGTLQITSKVAEADPETNALVPYTGSPRFKVLNGSAVPIRERRKKLTLDAGKRGQVVPRVVRQRAYQKWRNKGKLSEKGVVLRSMLPVAPDESETALFLHDGRAVQLSYVSRKDVESDDTLLGSGFRIPYVDVKVMSPGTKEQ